MPRWTNVGRAALSRRGSPRKHVHSLAFFLVVAGFRALFAPASAQASAVSVSGSTLSFVAADGEANDVTLALRPRHLHDHRRRRAASAPAPARSVTGHGELPVGRHHHAHLDGRDLDDAIVVRARPWRRP